jgi:hypothetical protein
MCARYLFFSLRKENSAALASVAAAGAGASFTTLYLTCPFVGSCCSQSEKESTAWSRTSVFSVAQFRHIAALAAACYRVTPDVRHAKTKLGTHNFFWSAS